MRHLFDQYKNPENRLTHALVCCLAEDPRLLLRFLRWVLGRLPTTVRPLQIVEQRLPGDPELSEHASQERGLPDAWVHDGEGWCLLIESKVASKIVADQLRKHIKTAARRGFQDVHILVIGLAPWGGRIPRRVIHRTWADVYAWCREQERRSDWARRVADYIEVAEVRMVAQGYLREGTLTMFTGIPFDRGRPYNYLDAKRLLGLAMAELRTRRELRRQLGVDPHREGRPAITGRDASRVWDFLPLRQARTEDAFTRFPHLILSIQSERVWVLVALPNGIRRGLLKSLIRLGKSGFADLIREVKARLARSLRKARGAAPTIQIVQRRYRTPSSEPVVDARLEYNLATAFPAARSGHGTAVKPQPQWLDATFEALAEKRSNLQIGVGAMFPYRTCRAIRSREALDLFEKTWLACKPVLDVLLGRRVCNSRGSAHCRGGSLWGQSFISH